MAEDQVAAAALDVEAPVDPAEGEAASNRYKGGFKPEHRQTPVVKRSPYSVTQGYSAVARVLIPPAEKALLFVIFSKVDSETWRWPPKHMELKRGSSVLELATLIGRSVRHTRRLLRKLEARGVLITYDRRPYRSEYQVVPEVLMELGRMGHQAVRDVLAADRDAAVATQAAADCRIDRAVGAPEEDAAPKADLAPPVAEELPFWANQLGRKHDLKPEFAAGLVRAAWRAAGEQGLWTREGGTGRMTVKVWRGLGEPGLDEWEALLESLASAVKAGRMNGLLPRNWSGHQTNLVRLAQNGEARRVAALHMAPPPPPAAVQRDSQSGSVRIEGHMLLPAMRTLERWNAEKAQVRSQLGTMLYDTWFRALEWVGLDGDETVVQAPNGVFGKWCAEHYSAVLAHMAGGPVRLQWEGVMVPVWKRVLDEVVRRPGLLDVDGLARRALPWPGPRRAPLPYSSSAERARELAARAAAQEQEAMHHAKACRQVANALRELVRRGLVKPAVQCSLEPETARVLKTHGVGMLRSFSFVEDEEEHGRAAADPLEVVDDDELNGHALAIVKALQEGPMAPGELRARTGGLTAAGNPRGSWTSAWDRLVADLAVLPLRNRWPTLRGIQAASQAAREAGGRVMSVEVEKAQHRAS